MTAATHLAFSYLVCSVAGVPQPVACAASLFALVPDIDHPESLIGRVFPFIARALLKKYGHRTLTHSLVAVGVVAIIAVPLLYVSVSWYGAVVLAYASHIFIDLFNLSGVRLLAPFSQREYISFRTEALRIRVRSWKEYAALFVIVLLALAASGQTVSLYGSVRAVSRLFYRHYDGALADYQNGSRYRCTARIEYFDRVKAVKVSGEYEVLNMFPEKIYLLVSDPDDHRRLILKKADILEIEITVSKNLLSRTEVSGTDLSRLKEIPSASFVSGTVTVKNYHPELRNTDYIKVEKTPSSTHITLIAALPHELTDIINIERDRNRELESLRSKTAVYQITRLQAEEGAVKKRITRLSQKGFYENYHAIARLNGELKKIESRIETLRMRDAAGADVDMVLKIEKLERDFGIVYSLNAINIKVEHL